MFLNHPLIRWLVAKLRPSPRASLVMAAVVMGLGFAPGQALACGPGLQPVVQMMPRSAAGPGADAWVPVTTCIPAPGDAPAGASGGEGVPDRFTNLRGVNNSGAVSLWVSASGERGYSFSRWGSARREGAESDAVEFCEKNGGVNCQPTLWCLNCHITVARDGNGELLTVYGASKKKAEKALRDACKRENIACTVLETRDFEAYAVRTNY